MPSQPDDEWDSYPGFDEEDDEDTDVDCLGEDEPDDWESEADEPAEDERLDVLVMRPKDRDHEHVIGRSTRRNDPGWICQ